MTTAFKDFDAVLAERRAKTAGRIAPTFQLGGETFTCKKQMSGLAAIQLGILASDSGAGLAEILKFLHQSLAKKELVRFDAVLENDDDGEYDIELFGDVVSWIVEQYAAPLVTPVSWDSPGTSSPSIA